jgi:putative transposase
MSRPPRIPGFDYRGPHRYFLTFCTFGRHRVLNDSVVAALVIGRLRHAAGRERFAILAYCLMPDHVHLLVEGLSALADMRRFAKGAKQGSGQAYLHHTGARLWQAGYYDRVLRPSDDARTVARYIIANPVRAGLVVTPLAYPHVGSDVWSLPDLLEGLG